MRKNRKMIWGMLGEPSDHDDSLTPMFDRRVLDHHVLRRRFDKVLREYLSQSTHESSPKSPRNGSACVSWPSSVTGWKQPWEAWTRYKCGSRFQNTAAGAPVQLHLP